MFGCLSHAGDRWVNRDKLKRSGQQTLLQEIADAVVQSRGPFVVTDARSDAQRGAECYLSALVSGHGPWGRGELGGGIIPSISLLSTATARRPPPSWPTPCGFSSRVPPLSSIMPYGRTPCSILPWPRRNPRPSSSVSSKSLRRSNSTRIEFSSTCPVPVRSKRFYSG